MPIVQFVSQPTFVLTTHRAFRVLNDCDETTMSKVLLERCSCYGIGKNSANRISSISTLEIVNASHVSVIEWQRPGTDGRHCFSTWGQRKGLPTLSNVWDRAKSMHLSKKVIS